MKTIDPRHVYTLLRSLGILACAALATLTAPTPNAQAQAKASPTAQPRADNAETAVTVRFGEGWFDEESLPAGPTRWMSGAGHLDVAAKRAGTLVTKGRIRSYVADNSVELLVDDKPVQTIKITGADWQDCVLRVPLSAGTHRLLLRSRQAGKQPPNDSRVLTICLENFQARLEP